MGTKLEPGKHDCWDKAEPEEPRFALLARDPLGADIVRLWVALRSRDLSQVMLVFAKLVTIAFRREECDSFHKLEEGREVAQSMEDWRADQVIADAQEQARRNGWRGGR